MLINNKTNIPFQTIVRKSLFRLSIVFTTLKNNLLQVKKTRKGSKSPLFSLLMISGHYLKMFLSQTLLSLHWSNFLSSSFFTKVIFCLYFLLVQAKACVCCMEEPSWELCYKSEKDGTNGHFSLAQDPNYRDWNLDSRKNSGKNISCQPSEILQSIYFPCVSKCHEFNSNLI